MENDNRPTGTADSRQELSSSLSRYVEKITREADEWAEQARLEAKERAEVEAKAITARAEVEARSLIEKTRAEAVAAARKETDFIKHQAQEQIEAWLKEVREALALQLRGIGGILHKEMLTQSEALKRRASLFEVDFEQQMAEMLKKEIVIEGVAETKPAEAVQTPAQPQPAPTAPPPVNGKIDKWVELKIAPPTVIGVLQTLKARIDQLPDVSTSQVTTLGGNTSVHVYIKKPVNLRQALISFPEVRRVEEVVEKGENKFKVTLVENLPAGAVKDVSRKEAVDKSKAAVNEIILNWQ